MNKKQFIFIIGLNFLFFMTAISLILYLFRYEYQTETNIYRGISFSKTYKINRFTGESCQIAGNGNFNCREFHWKVFNNP